MICCPHNWRRNDEFQLEVNEIIDVIFSHPCSQNSVLGQLEFKNCYRVRPHNTFSGPCWNCVLLKYLVDKYPGAVHLGQKIHTTCGAIWLSWRDAHVHSKWVCVHRALRSLHSMDGRQRTLYRQPFLAAPVCCHSVKWWSPGVVYSQVVLSQN